MKSFYISAPAAALLERANLDPVQMNAVLDQRVKRREEVLLRPGHPYPSLVRKRTKAPLMMVARKHRRILIEMESNQPFWRYREYNRGDCRLLIAGDLPETFLVAASGKRIDDLIDGLPHLSEVVIKYASVEDGFYELALDPAWLRYPRT